MSRRKPTEWLERYGTWMDLRLPAPCLVVLVGPSMTGKTTWAQTHFQTNEVVSSDGLRAMVGIGEEDQRASAVAFSLLSQIVKERLNRSLTTVIDTTGLNEQNRQSWVEAAHEAGMPVYAILFNTSHETAAPLNEARAHPIPKSVFRKQFSAFKKVSEQIGSEGFDGVFEEQPVRAVTRAIAESATPELSPGSSGHTFGLLLSRFDWATEALGDQMTDIARRAEEAGFRDLWVMDHFRQIRQVGRPWEDIPEAYTALGYLAGITSTLRLGALVSGVTHRNPVLLGKMMATLDVLSGGRMICGIGAAWDEEEHQSYAMEFPSLSTRYATLEDTLEMLPLLWGKGTPSFQGKTFSTKELISYPRPIQQPIPIMVGGSGEEKTLRLVARFANACNLFGDPDTVRRKVEILHTHCGEVGRDPAEIEVTHLTRAMADVDAKALRNRIDRLRERNTTAEQYAARYNAGTIEDLTGLFTAYRDAGAQHSIVSLPDPTNPDSMAKFGDVIANFGVS